MCRHRIVRTREEKLSHADSQTQKLVFLSSWSHFLFQSLLLVRPFDFLVTQKKKISSCALSEIFLAGVMSDEGGKGKKNVSSREPFTWTVSFETCEINHPSNEEKQRGIRIFHSDWEKNSRDILRFLLSLPVQQQVKFASFLSFSFFFGNRRKANCNFVFFWLRCFSSSPSRC